MALWNRNAGFIANSDRNLWALELGPGISLGVGQHWQGRLIAGFLFATVEPPLILNVRGCWRYLDSLIELNVTMHSLSSHNFTVRLSF